MNIISINDNTFADYNISSRIRKDILTPYPFVSITTSDNLSTKEIILSKKELSALRMIVKSENPVLKYHIDSLILKSMEEKELIELSIDGKHIIVNEAIEAIIQIGDMRGSMVIDMDNKVKANIYWGNFCA